MEEQLTLVDIDSGKPAESVGVSKNVYYVALSQMQKAIRLGLGVDALRAGRLCWMYNQWMMFRRLHVILFEDCGRDHDLIEWASHFYESGGSFKNWDSVAEFIVRMCEAKKTHELVIGLVLTGHLYTERSPEFLSGTPLEPYAGETWEKVTALERGKIASLEEVWGHVAPDMSPHMWAWLNNVITKITSHEKQAITYPFWWAFDRQNGQKQTVDQTLEVPDVLRSHENILLNALDGHTMIGKRLLRWMISNEKCSLGQVCKDEDRCQFAEWMALGGKLRNALPDDSVQKRFSTVALGSVVDWYSSNAKKVMELREWGLTKWGSDIIKGFAI